MKKIILIGPVYLYKGVCCNGTNNTNDMLCDRLNLKY